MVTLPGNKIVFAHDVLLVPPYVTLCRENFSARVLQSGTQYSKEWLLNESLLGPHDVLYAIPVVKDLTTHEGISSEKVIELMDKIENMTDEEYASLCKFKYEIK